MSMEYWLQPLVSGLTVGSLLLQAGVGRSLPKTTMPLSGTEAGERWYQVQQGRSLTRLGAPSANTPGTAALSREESDLLSARNEYARYQQLYQEGAISRQQRDQAESNYKFAQAQSNQRPQFQRFQQSSGTTQAKLRSELARLEADIPYKQLVYQRYQTLYREGAIGCDRLIQAGRDYQQALARREAIQKKLRSLP